MIALARCRGRARERKRPLDRFSAREVGARERALVRVGTRGRVRVGAKRSSVAAPHPSQISPVHNKKNQTPI